MKTKYWAYPAILAVALLVGAAAAACGSSPAAPAATVTPFIIDAGPTEVAVVETPIAAASPIAISDEGAAPRFTLASFDGRQVSLADLLEGREAVVIVFYRGFF